MDKMEIEKLINFIASHELERDYIIKAYYSKLRKLVNTDKLEDDLVNLDLIEQKDSIEQFLYSQRGSTTKQNWVLEEIESSLVK